MRRQDDAVATITIQEGFKAGIMSGRQVHVDESIAADACDDFPRDPGTVMRNARDGDTVLVSFMGIPEGVSVMVPGRGWTSQNDSGTSADEDD